MSPPQPPPLTEYYAVTPGERRGGAGLAIASMVCGIMSVVVFYAWYLSIPCGVTGLVLGIIARKRIARGEAEGHGMATTGIICASTGLALSLLIGVATLVFVANAPRILKAMGTPMPPPGGNGRVVLATRSNLQPLDAALRAFKVDTGRYPTTAEGLNALVTRPAGLTGWRGPYAPTIPLDGWGRPYLYRQPASDGTGFDLLSTGPDGIEGGGDDISLRR